MKTKLVIILAFLSVSFASALESGQYLISCFKKRGDTLSAEHRGYILAVDDDGTPSFRVPTSLESKGDTTKVLDIHLMPGEEPDIFILTARFEEMKLKGGNNGTPKKYLSSLTLVFSGSEGEGCEVSMVGGRSDSNRLIAFIGVLPK